MRVNDLEKKDYKEHIKNVLCDDERIYSQNIPKSKRPQGLVKTSKITSPQLNDAYSTQYDIYMYMEW